MGDTLYLNDTIYDYLVNHSVREDDILKELRQETAKLSSSLMQITPVQGQFMGLLAEILGAKKALEIGVFTGYSGICVARALPENGQLIACDINEEWTELAQMYWQKAGVRDKIELRLAPALDTLDTLIADGQNDSVDFAFIDADKQNQGHYYEKVLTLLRPGGVVIVDNVLWDGKVAAKEITNPSTLAIHQLNQRIFADERVSMSMLPLGDGIIVARKR